MVDQDGQAQKWTLHGDNASKGYLTSEVRLKGQNGNMHRAKCRRDIFLTWNPKCSQDP
jgi:hypothetical protein